MRVPYSAKATFFRDGVVGDNRINWYIVPDDTPYYDGITPFWARIDVPKDEAFPVYENEGDGRTVRIKDWGLIAIPPLPHGVDGDDEDFRGQSLHTKYMIDGAPPVQPCLVLFLRRAGFRFGFSLIDPRLILRGAGVRLGASVVSPTPAVLKAATRLGASLIALPPPRLPAGLQLGAGLVDGAPPPRAGVRCNMKPIATVPVYGAGIRMGGELVEPDLRLKAGVRIGALKVAPPIAELTAGVRIGADEVEPMHLMYAGVRVGAELDQADRRLDAGVQLGAELDHTDDTFTAGVQLGAELDHTDDTFTAGVQLGADDIDPDGSNTCETAIVVTLGVPYSGTASDGAEVWLTCPATSTGSYTVTVTITSGVGGFEAWHGTCDANNFDGGQPLDYPDLATESYSATATAGDNLYCILTVASGYGPMAYTVTISQP